MLFGKSLIDTGGEGSFFRFPGASNGQGLDIFLIVFTVYRCFGLFIGATQVFVQELPVAQVVVFAALRGVVVAPC